MRRFFYLAGFVFFIFVLANSALAQQNLLPPSNNANPELNERLNRIQKEMTDVQSFIYRADGSVQQNAAQAAVQTQSISASTVATIGQIEEELRRVKGRQEELEFKIKSLEEQQRKIAEDNEFRFKQLEDKPKKTTTATIESPAEDELDKDLRKPEAAPEIKRAFPESKSESPAQSPASMKNESGAPGESKPLGVIKGTKAAPADKTVQVTPAKTGGNKDQFDSAFGLLKDGEREQAVAEFESFISANPKDKRLGSAHYWIGEAYYADKNYTSAAKKYVESYKKFPKGDKAPEALVKLAASLEKLDKKKEACTTLSEFSGSFPQANANVKKRATEQKKRLSCG